MTYRKTDHLLSKVAFVAQDIAELYDQEKIKGEIARLEAILKTAKPDDKKRVKYALALHQTQSDLNKLGVALDSVIELLEDALGENEYMRGIVAGFDNRLASMEGFFAIYGFKGMLGLLTSAVSSSQDKPVADPLST